MDLYTVLMELNGGTYISQVQADDELEAFKNWASQLDNHQIKDVGTQIKKRLIEQLQSNDELDRPKLLDGMRNVWFTYLNVRGRRMWINIGGSI